MYTLAVDIGGTKLAVGLFEGEVLLDRASLPTVREGGPQWMVEAIERLATNWVKRYEVGRCGIGFGGPVDFVTQQVVCSTHVEGWEDFDLVGALHQRLGVHSVIDRDTMVGALGEGYYGAGVGARPLFYITVSTGIGGGLLNEEGLFHGHNSFACEIGHHCVDPDGPECLCGARGCLERLCAGIWLERDFGKPASELLLESGFVSEYVKPLARGLKNAIMFFNPARIVIGGGISKAGDRLFVPLREELSRQITPWSKATVDVVPPQLGDNTILYGALALATIYQNKLQEQAKQTLNGER